MSDERDSQLSAMFDGELSKAECELLARRLGRDTALRAQWQRYALISAALQAEPGMRLDLQVAHRVSAALAAEPVLAEEGAADPARLPARGAPAHRWMRPLAGVAVAASVAALSILYLRTQAPLGEGAPVVAQRPAAAAAPQVAASTPGGGELPEAAPAGAGGEPERYVVPASSEQVAPIVPAELANYVVAHSEYSPPIGRRNLLSALITAEPAVPREADFAAPDAADDPNREAMRATTDEAQP